VSTEPSRPAGEHEYYEGARLYRQERLLGAEQVRRRGIERYREAPKREEDAPEHPWCHSLLGAILAETKKDSRSLDEAQEHLRQAAEASDFDAPGIVRNFALFLLQKRHDPKQAEAVVRQAISGRRHHETYAVLGYVLEQQGRWDDARAQYLEAIRRLPTLLGYLFEKKLEPPKTWQDVTLQEIRSWYLEAIAGRPRDTETLWDWNLGHWYAVAMDGFARTSSKLYERMQFRPLRRLSYVLLGLLLVESVALPASIRPHWLPILTWTEWMQVALLVAAVALWLLPYLLQDARVRKVQFWPPAVEFFEPRMGFPGNVEQRP